MPRCARAAPAAGAAPRGTRRARRRPARRSARREVGFARGWHPSPVERRPRARVGLDLLRARRGHALDREPVRGAQRQKSSSAFASAASPALAKQFATARCNCSRAPRIVRDTGAGSRGRSESPRRRPRTDALRQRARGRAAVHEVAFVHRDRRRFPESASPAMLSSPLMVTSPVPARFALAARRHRFPAAGVPARPQAARPARTRGR